jgi:hypothetical protein
MPVVCVPAAASETVNPALRAKAPPEVIGTTTGTCVKALKRSGEMMSTGLLPCCS